ncbi:MAG: hypothetical protein ACXAB7_09345 [Candidatus Kariarchaeaceae archaeon]|jgi:DNA-binding HxlR family transcriptional regulator
MVPPNNELIQLIQETVEKEIDPLKKEMEVLIESINRDLKLNYLNSIARFLEKEAIETIDNFNCSYHYSASVACKQSLEIYFSKYTQALAMGDMANAFSILKEFEELARENANDKKDGGNCHKDWGKITRVLSRHKDVAKDISALYMAREVPSDIGELDFSPEDIFEEVIFPFSHPLRIQIIHSLKSGSKRFTTLKNELNVKNTGLLVHHLKPLTAASLVVQDHRKQYSLSEKGFIIARYFAQITAAMHPETPATVKVQPLVVLNDQ